MSSPSTTPVPASTTPVPAPISDLNTIYHSSLDSACKMTSFTAELPNKTRISFIGVIGGINNNSITKIVRKEWKCNICVSRAHYLSSLIDSNGVTFCSHDGDKTDMQNKLDSLIKNNLKILNQQNYNPKNSSELNPSWSLKIVSSNNKNYIKEMGMNSMGVQFKHYYLNYNNTPHTISNIEKIDLYNKALKKYVPLIYAMLMRISKHEYDWKAIISSFGILKELLKTVAYANVLLGSVKWFDNINKHIESISIGNFKILTIHDKMAVIGNAILGANIKGEYDDPVITLYHQFNDNVLGLLQTANSEKAMIKLLKERFDPAKYQQRTAPPKAGAVKIAIDTLGDWNTTISTTTDIQKYPECVTIVSKSTDTDKSPSSMDVMNSLLSESRCSKYNFAKRAQPIETTYSPTTISALIKLVKEGKIHTLEIDTNKHINAYIAEVTGMKPEHRIAPYAWAYLNGETSRFISNYYKITHIMPINYERLETYIFIINNSKTCRRITTNIGWAEYLDVSIRRTCGTTFAEVARKKNISYPTNGELAIGIGVSPINSNNTLNIPLKVRINGTTELTLYNAK
jgi:hypothetical protein